MTLHEVRAAERSAESGAPRYAVYAVPGALPSDSDFAHEVKARAEAEIARTTAARRYGYHATLKAPFRLGGDDLLVLERTAANFAAKTAPVTIPRLDLRRIGGFWALAPGGEAPALHHLADSAVTRFDAFRAPLTDAEIERRHPERLTQHQGELLAQWGYPFVFDEFRCHITLTDEVGDDPVTAARLRSTFAELLGNDLPVTSIALFVEPGPGADFLVHSIHPLTGTVDAKGVPADKEHR